MKLLERFISPEKNAPELIKAAEQLARDQEEGLQQVLTIYKILRGAGTGFIVSGASAEIVNLIVHKGIPLDAPPDQLLNFQIVAGVSGATLVLGAGLLSLAEIFRPIFQDLLDKEKENA